MRISRLCRWALLILPIAFNLGEAQAQRWQTYTTQGDLADDFVLSIFQSQDGVMWFGTLQGVSRFDGAFWQAFGASVFDASEQPDLLRFVLAYG